MNYITVVSDDTPAISIALLASFNKHGGGEPGDTLTLLSSTLTAKSIPALAADCGQFFDEVKHISIYAIGLTHPNYETFSEQVMANTLFRSVPIGPCCFFSMGRVPSEDDWARRITLEYRTCSKKFMGYTHPVGGDSTLSYIEGPFVMDGYNFRVIPMFKGWHRSGPSIKRALCYTAPSLHHLKLPFRKFDVPEEKVTKTKEVGAKKVGTIATKRPAAKKAAKKAPAKKRAPRKAPTKKPLKSFTTLKKVISDETIKSASPEDKTEN